MNCRKFYTEHENASLEGFELEVRSEVADGGGNIFVSAAGFDAEAAASQGLQSAVGSAINGGNPRIISTCEKSP